MNRFWRRAKIVSVTLQVIAIAAALCKAFVIRALDPAEAGRILIVVAVMLCICGGFALTCHQPR